MLLSPDDPLAALVVNAIHSGDVDALRDLLASHPHLAISEIGDHGERRSLLHIATDWPGHFPNNVATVNALIEHGADVNARFHGAHTETPLHWAASCDDVEVIDALLDAGADIEATGAVIAGGTPIADATAFAQWNAARRLVERGAQTNLYESASMGLLDRISSCMSGPNRPTGDEITAAFWGACAGGQLAAAQLLAEHGARWDWVSDWDGRTPLAAARDARDEESQREASARQPARQFAETVAWLETLLAS